MINVLSFAQNNIKDKEVQRKFYYLMREWDGRNDVGFAFYDKDLLIQKKKEAIESTR